MPCRWILRKQLHSLCATIVEPVTGSKLRAFYWKHHNVKRFKLASVAPRSPSYWKHPNVKCFKLAPVAPCSPSYWKHRACRVPDCLSE